MASLYGPSNFPSSFLRDRIGTHVKAAGVELHVQTLMNFIIQPVDAACGLRRYFQGKVLVVPTILVSSVVRQWTQILGG